jgi:hypothetical protein
MGAVSSQEDSVERFIGSTWTKWEVELGDVTLPSPKPVLKYCPLCVQGYLEESSLDQHVAREHGKQHIYLKVNDRIVRDICWLTRKLDKCELFIVEMPETHVEIEFNGTSRQCTISPSAPSLMDAIPAGAADGLVRVKAQCNHMSRDFQIYLGKQPDFRPEVIDEAVIGLMERIRLNQNGDLAGFRRKWSKKGLNELEQRYLDGVLEYCHGWMLEQGGNQAFARDRIEAAMHLLIPFKTVLAEDMRSALALRMNIFAGRWGCDEASPFRSAELFFCADGQDSSLSGTARETKILVDPISQRILEAIEAYHANNDRWVFAILNDLRPKARDRNDEDKVAILEARTRRNMGDRRAAATAYETLLDHPLFGKEAQTGVKERW